MIGTGSVAAGGTRGKAAYREAVPPIPAQVLDEFIAEAAPMEGKFSILSARQQAHQAKAGTPDHLLSLELQRARQAINKLVSLRLHALAQALGISDTEFRHRYLPKHQDEFWFCRPELGAHQSPSEYLRRVRQTL